jgi:hypothetical protein
MYCGHNNLSNEFNTELQAKDKLLCYMFCNVKAFERKPNLLHFADMFVRKSNLSRFPSYKRLSNLPLHTDKLAGKIKQVQNEHSSRFERE